VLLWSCDASGTWRFLTRFSDSGVAASSCGEARNRLCMFACMHACKHAGSFEAALARLAVYLRQCAYSEDARARYEGAPRIAGLRDGRPRPCGHRIQATTSAARVWRRNSKRCLHAHPILLRAPSMWSHACSEPCLAGAFGLLSLLSTRSCPLSLSLSPARRLSVCATRFRRKKRPNERFKRRKEAQNARRRHRRRRRYMLRRCMRPAVLHRSGASSKRTLHEQHRL